MSKIKLILATLCTFLALIGFNITVQAESYKYDDLNRLTEVTYDSGQKITYTYDAGGNILSVTNEAVASTLEGISFDMEEYKMSVGQTQNTIVTASYTDGQQKVVTEGVSFTSSQPSIAKVDSVGKINALVAGETVLSATYEGNTVTAMIKVIAVADTVTPSKPMGLAVSGKTEKSISLTWQAAIDNTGVEGYEIYRDSVKISETISTNYTDSGLVSGKGYNYFVKAFDAADNLSEASDKVFAVTDVVPITNGDIKVQMFNSDKGTTSNSISPRFKLYNTGSTTIKLSDVKIRYYYTIDGDKAQNFWCDWSTVGSSNITSKFVKIDSTKEGADYYLEIGFTAGAGTLASNANVEVQGRFSKADWTSYTQSGDFSFNSTAASYIDWTKISGYIANEIKWGAEPPDAKPIPIVESIKIQVFNSNRETISNTINPRFKLNNTGNKEIKLSDVKIRYYYTIDGDKTQNFWCDWSSIGSSNITSKLVKLDPAKENADYYLEIGFTSGAGTLGPGANVEVQGRFSKTDWTNYTQSGDYSFNDTASSYVDWTKIAGYIANEIKWGVEPLDAEPIPVEESIKIQMFNSSRGTTSNTINPRFKLYNTGNTTIKLSDVKLRYYYTIDGDIAQNFWCDWSSVGGSNVTSKFVKLDSAKEGADYYLEIGFITGAGTLTPGTSIEVQGRFAKTDWSNYTQSRDYSFNDTASSYVDWTNIIGCIANEIKWGAEP